MKYFRVNREDFWELFPDIPKEEQPEELYVFEDGTAYANLSDSCYWEENFFNTDEKSFKECANDFGAEIED